MRSTGLKVFAESKSIIDEVLRPYLKKEDNHETE